MITLKFTDDTDFQQFVRSLHTAHRKSKKTGGSYSAFRNGAYGNSDEAPGNTVQFEFHMKQNHRASQEN